MCNRQYREILLWLSKMIKDNLKILRLYILCQVQKMRDY